LVEAGSGAEVTIDLPNQKVLVGSQAFPFEINAVTKDALVEGLDLIGTTLRYSPQIDAYERSSEAYVPNRS
jgi:3-isopropylmalate/(R)-2-methylmalate dehydratase small subunit